MALIAAAMLWGILRIGNGLHAPPDISGTWELASTGQPSRHAVIDQSGVYLRMKIDQEPTKAYTLTRSESGTWGMSAGDGGFSIWPGETPTERSVQLVDSNVGGPGLFLIQNKHASR